MRSISNIPAKTIQHTAYIRLFPVLSSLLLGAAFTNTHLGWVVLIGLAPYVWYAAYSASLSAKQVVFDCCLAAFVLTLITGGWTLQVAPSTWIVLRGPMTIIAKTAVWLAFATFAALSMGSVMSLFIIKFRHNIFKLLLILPFAWALGELLRSYSLAVFMFGPGGSLSPNWNFGSLGLGVASTPLVYIGRFIGLYGLSAVACAVNIAIYLAIRRKLKPATAIVSFVLVCSLLGWLLYLPSHATKQISVVNLVKNNESLKIWENITLPPKNTDLLVLPEYSHFFENRANFVFAHKNFGENTVVMTSQHGKGHPKTNDLLYYTNKDGIISRQPKTFLAPFGEYMPYSVATLLKAGGQGYTVASFQRFTQVGKGAQPEKVIESNGLRIGGLACSGVLSLNEYRRLSADGADILANSASLGLIQKAGLYHVQETYQNRFHAVANAKPLVQATRSGESYVISSDGKVLIRSNSSSQLTSTTVHLQPKKTIYSLL